MRYDLRLVGRCTWALTLATAELVCMGAIRGDVLEETFDDNALLPDFRRRVDGGWSPSRQPK